MSSKVTLEAPTFTGNDVTSFGAQTSLWVKSVGYILASPQQSSSNGLHAGRNDVEVIGLGLEQSNPAIPGLMNFELIRGLANSSLYSLM